VWSGVTTQRRGAILGNRLEKLCYVANLSSMEMFDVGPTLGASIAHLLRREVPWVGSTSGATVATNIDVFEVGANIVLLS